MDSTLEQLKCDDFLIRTAFIATIEAKYEYLKKLPEVEALQNTIPFISFDELTAFVHSIPFEKGKRSSYDDTFAALAVALEPYYVHGRANTQADYRRFAEDFLLGLAGLNIAELPMAPRIAKIVLNNCYGSVN